MFYSIVSVFCAKIVKTYMHRILILGSGGREHALAWKICQSDLCQKLYTAPGNGGTSSVSQNVDLDISNFRQIAEFCEWKNVEFIIVGPEQPLVDGIVDYFLENHPKIKVFGPDKQAAQLEGSKDFANQFMAKYNIPTAGSKSFELDQLNEGLEHIRNSKGPYVLKADGLAAGKGVLIIEDQEEALIAFKEMLGGKFGKASSKVVIEEFLDGIEFSVFVLTNGKEYVLLPEAKDYKRIGEGDQGLNTGGMGAVSPVPFVDENMMKKVKDRIIQPTINGFKAENMNYTGFVFIGLIKVGEDPYVIEYNCRMGDPETEVVIPRIESDLMELIQAAFEYNLSEKEIKTTSQSACTVMMVSGGYPEKYEKGKSIEIPEKCNGSLIFHAGTKSTKNGLFTNGGRVLAITSFNDNFQDAVIQSMNLADKINFENKFFRRDIGFDL